MDHYLPLSLTGRVIKIEVDCFAYGGFADIWKAAWARNDSDIVEVAVKVPRVSLTNTEDLAKCTKSLLREARIWDTLKHPNITPFYGTSFDFHRAPTPCLVSPYYRHGDAATFLKKRLGVDRMQLVAQAAMALSHLHSLPRPIIHGNIKASNILINDNLEASLSDFGLSRILEESGYMTKASSGTMPWQAYELIIPCKDGEEESISPIAKATDICLQITEEENTSPRVGTAESWRWKAYELVAPCVKEDFIPRVTAATDVWAFAMTVIEIVTGYLPFSHIKSDSGVILAIASGGHPKRDRYPPMNNEIWAMLERCWNIDPNQRPSMAVLARFFASQVTSLSVQRARL